VRRPWLALLLGVACGGGSATSTPDAASSPDAGPTGFTVNAVLEPAAAEASQPAGRRPDGTALIPGGRRLTPAGEVVEIGGWLLGARVLPGGRHLITTDAAVDDEYLSVVDLATRQVVQRERFGRDRALFLGLAVRADGDLFVSGGGSDRIYHYRYDPQAPQPLSPAGEIVLGEGNYVAGLAFVDERRLLAAYQLGSAVALIDTDAIDGGEVARLSLGSDQTYDVVVDATRQEAWISAWNASAVSVVTWDDDSLSLVARVTTGKNPEGMVLWPPAAPEKLLAASSDSDSVTVIDLDSRMPERTLGVAPPERDEFGVVPTALALSADGARLYVVASGDNAVDAYDTTTWTRLGRIPTGWYPTSVVPLADGRLAITSGKGLGAGPVTGTPGDNTIMKGTLALVAPPSVADLDAGETQVEANNLRPGMVGPRVTCPQAGECRYPLPPRPGLPTPIEHVVFVVRENKTYDATLGDLEGANGDARLTTFGERYTPNLHALARAFVNGDNFYSNAEASIQGHHWTVTGMANDYIEKAWLTTWGRHTRPVTDTGGQKQSAPEQGHYWQYLARNGIDYMSFGQIVGLTGQRPGDPPFRIDPAYPGSVQFNIGLANNDVEKADYLRRRIVDDGILHRFSYVLFPGNHTYGLEPGKWTPEFMVSSNDEATGRLVDAISHSPFWPSTVVFIIEDDPADGYDHVEAHRSTLVVVSPWVKRRFVTSLHYDNASLWRTMELLLGLAPFTQQTATAAPMFDIWATEPDLTPYTFISGNIAEAFNPPRAKPSGLDFSHVDSAPGLGKILWRHMKGSEPPWELPWDPSGDDEADEAAAEMASDEAE